MSKWFFGLVATASVATFSLVGPSMAATLVLGPGVFSPALCTPTCTGSFNNGPEKGPIDDIYTFQTLTGGLVTSDSATNSSTGTSQEIKNFAIELWAGIPAAGHVGDTPLASGVGPFQNPFGQFTGFLSDVIGPGHYFLELTGTGGTTKTTYSGSYAFAPTTPLPGTLPLFASGLAALWAWQRRRRAVA